MGPAHLAVLVAAINAVVDDKFKADLKPLLKLVQDKLDNSTHDN